LVFLGLLPLVPLAGALVLGPLRRLGPPARAADTATPDEQGRVATAVRLAAGASLLVAGLTQRHLLLVVPMAGAGVALGLPALRRLLPSGTVRARPGVPAAIAFRAVLVFGFFGTEAFLPLMLTSVRHRTTTAAGVVLTAAALSWTAGSWVQARMATRWTFRRFASAAWALIVVALAGAGAALLPAVPVWTVAVAWAVGGLAMGLGYSQSSLVVLAEAPPDEVGVTSAALSLAEV